MENTVIFEGEVNGVKVNTVNDYNKMIKEHLNNGTLKSASSSTRVEESENQDKPKIMFEGEVNGVKVNTVEEYNKLIAQHVNDGTLKSASSSTRVEEQDDDNPLNHLSSLDPKFHRLLQVIGDALDDKYLGDNNKLTRDFYKDFHSELKKLTRGEVDLDSFDIVVNALEDVADFYDHVYMDYNIQLHETEQELIEYLTNVVNDTDEDIISVISEDDAFEQLRNRHNKLVSHMDHYSRWTEWCEYMIEEIGNKL